ncbi:hypothetical protein ACFSQD_07235 [Flavihumibacter stibioxidans]|uniref:Outer membrane protein beta-barrel domain-containing protein n=1 Tax=Flavihumibacter stibioxidans TaxID=1834163 RepID=A0ABR7M5V4_9BACT|nr:hypothetical protein [Flavihumibacter stibioxidans]MBC6490105.1 hypothetical protein [Flavihumibacter stibioxidans]
MKFLLFIAAFFSVSVSNGQLSQNTWLLGGSGSFYSYNEHYTHPSIDVTGKYTSIDLSGTVGYFFAEKLGCGLRPFLTSYKGESSGGGINNNIKFAIGPFARYYFLKPDKQFNLLADVSYQFGVNANNNPPKDRGKFNQFFLMGGSEVFFNSSVGLEILLGYSHKLHTANDPSGTFRSSKNGFQMSIGFHFHLEKE